MLPDALLKVQDLHAWYGESHILHGMEFEVGEGEVVTLLGRNGAGKTTTLRSIMGLVRQRQGSVTFGRQRDHPAAGERHCPGWASPSAQRNEAFSPAST